MDIQSHQMNTHLWITRIIMALVSLFQATSLRDRYYTLQQRCEILEVAMQDIERINANSATPNALISGIVQHVKKL